jgi:UDP-N-acetylmuramyl pentapeptide synthase
MTFMRSAALAAIMAAAALGTSLTAANAHGKKHHHHPHHLFHSHSHGLIVLGTSVDPCIKWYHRYLRTGHKAFLYRYHACMR